MRYLKFVIPLLLLALTEWLFRMGVWERFAYPLSHAGTSIRIKRALEDKALEPIDFVTIGSSRPEYGIDHQLVKRAAQSLGFTHANLSMPGTHWMSIGVFTQWLAQHHPEIRGGVIALSIQDFIFAGNGEYELGIAYPFHTLSDTTWMAEHVPFDRNNLATYGLYSALFAYREDIQDLVRHPIQRQVKLLHYRAIPPANVLFNNADESFNLCGIELKHVPDCDAIDVSADAHLKSVLDQCTQVRAGAQQGIDFHELMRHELPPWMKKTQTLIQGQLRQLHWRQPPIVVFMPVHRIWTNDLLGTGLHEWARSILEPLEKEGLIHVLDYTELFNNGEETDCTTFFDLYHNNIVGRARLTEVLLPKLNELLYQSVKDTGAITENNATNPIDTAHHP